MIREYSGRGYNDMGVQQGKAVVREYNDKGIQ